METIAGKEQGNKKIMRDHEGTAKEVTMEKEMIEQFKWQQWKMIWKKQTVEMAENWRRKLDHEETQCEYRKQEYMQNQWLN